MSKFRQPRAKCQWCAAWINFKTGDCDCRPYVYEPKRRTK